MVSVSVLLWVVLFTVGGGSAVSATGPQQLPILSWGFLIIIVDLHRLVLPCCCHLQQTERVRRSGSGFRRRSHSQHSC